MATATALLLHHRRLRLSRFGYPEIAGRYFYSDYCSGWLRSFLVANGAATEQRDWNIAPIGNIQSFGVDSANEIYALTADGGVFKLVRE